MQAGGVGEDTIYSVYSHGYGICCDVESKHEMEKVLFASDELTGLIWSTALMCPSKSVMDMEVKSFKKKFKDKHFAAGYSRDVIKEGAERLGWELYLYKFCKRKGVRFLKCLENILVFVKLFSRI